ncbi:MAG: DegT/DnrJ/EryC1/StrS family aminotransferase [Candidatus Nealsonbacteria bacterium]|nr:DegT/DnrJ/EryC1/StrS family aminotransferase [Candidatus Nealsonbacteria bacterium]
MGIDIPMIKPKFGREEEQAIRDVVNSGWIAQGERVNEFERKVASYLDIQAERVVALSSGTAALHLALLLADVGPGDEVLVPASGFIATANAVLYCGATPVFVDVDRWLHTSDVEHFAQGLSDKTRAIIPVHSYGRMASMDRLTEWADAHSLCVVEDAAPAFGASLAGRPAGLWGTYGCFSLHSSKSFTTGEGGILVAPNQRQADRARSLRFHGADTWDFTKVDFQAYWEEHFTEMGFNYRMTDLQAAVGCVQLERLPQFLQNRAALAKEYSSRLVQLHEVLFLPPDTPDILPAATSFQQYVVVQRDGNKQRRDRIIAAARRKGMFFAQGGYCLPAQPMWQKLKGRYRVAGDEGARFAEKAALSLPLFVDMSTVQVNTVAAFLAAEL